MISRFNHKLLQWDGSSVPIKKLGVWVLVPLKINIINSKIQQVVIQTAELESTKKVTKCIVDNIYSTYKNKIFNSLFPAGWFQTTLYTRVLVNITKRMKKHPFYRARLSINILFFIRYPTTPSTLSKIQRLIKKKSIVDREICTTILSVVLFGSEPNKIISYQNS